MASTSSADSRAVIFNKSDKKKKCIDDLLY